MSRNIKLIYTFLGILICLVVSVYGSDAYEDVYDLSGNLIFNGDSLYEFWSYHSPEGGYKGQYYRAYANNDRFLRDFGSSMTIYEWINEREYELKLGRFSTWFTPLTLHKERFRWGYPGSYYNSWDINNGRWWDQRSARLRISKGANEWIALIAKTADSGSDDDSYWTEDIDKDRYFVAFRKTAQIYCVKLGLSFVNQHYTQYKTSDDSGIDFIDDMGPMTGLIADDPPTDIYIRIRDDSPYDEDGKADHGGAAVYSVKVFINGNTEYRLSVVNGNDAGSLVSVSGVYTSFTDRLEASGPGESITYKFILPTDLDEEITSVKFQIVAANDYRMEVSRDNGAFVPYREFARAQGNIKDYSNNTAVTYYYGENTGDTVLGFDMSGVIPYVNVLFKAEYAGSNKFFKYPDKGGKRINDAGTAWYVKMNKEFFSVLLVGEVY
ncbi:hypothetical protein ACFLTD_02645, partial [Elusimicrobiota bacterium]